MPKTKLERERRKRKEITSEVTQGISPKGRAPSGPGAQKTKPLPLPEISKKRILFKVQRSKNGFDVWRRPADNGASPLIY